ncbi:MAG: DUF3378 domain-containing protein [Streptococcus sp.]
MDYFFRLEGATVSIYKSGKVLLQGNDSDSLPGLFRTSMPRTLNGSTTTSAVTRI